MLFIFFFVALARESNVVGNDMEGYNCVALLDSQRFKRKNCVWDFSTCGLAAQSIESVYKAVA